MKPFAEIHKRTAEIYQKHAKAWDLHRPKVFFEKAWLDKFIDPLPTSAKVLDLGCGAGEPIASYLIEHGFNVTGVDISSAMLEICRSRFPDASWIEQDMRELNMPTNFDGIVSWDAFFHLNQTEQRNTLKLLSDHLNDNGALLLTIGHEAGEVLGTVEGESVYHSSLAPQEYKDILYSFGFSQVEIELEDESCGFHTVLLAQKGNSAIQNIT
ncbi:MAG: class I SAM-dependent methyltransferase [Gammaproteobacteria bacterium]|nr:class I SAM-dependent methyltransferase [Gammaproteobacteria bacterium]